MSGQAPSRTALGRAAEDLAAAWLAAEGWSIVARNWRRGPGELDIVASKSGEIAFVEVKRIDAYGEESLELSVGQRKRRRLIETSKLFLLAYREFSCMNARYDLIAVRGGTVSKHYERAFSERT